MVRYDGDLDDETSDETHFPAKISTIGTPYVSLCAVTCGGFYETSALTLPKFQVVTMLVIGIYYLRSRTWLKLRPNYIDLLPTINFTPSNSLHRPARFEILSPHLSFFFLIVDSMGNKSENNCHCVAPQQSTD